MGTWILETLLWAIVTVAVCVAIWGLNMTNILIIVCSALSKNLGNIRLLWSWHCMKITSKSS